MFRQLLLSIVLTYAAAFSITGNRLVKSSLSMVKMPPPPSEVVSGKNVVETAKGSGSHNTLVAAVVAAKLDGVLSGAGPFAVFAPTDAAFAKLPAGTVDGLLKDVPKLTNILKFHVSDNQQKPNRNGRTYNTLLNNDDGTPKELGIRVTVDTAENFVLHGTPNKAKVTSNIKCTNGYIHVIDEVLMPYEGKIPPSMILKNTDDKNLHN